MSSPAFGKGAGISGCSARSAIGLCVSNKRPQRARLMAAPGAGLGMALAWKRGKAATPAAFDGLSWPARIRPEQT